MRQMELEEVWQRLADDDASLLIDVRTVAEWTFVGVPDLSPLDKEARFVEWTRFPGGDVNPEFVPEATSGVRPDQPLLMLCRSGARSAAAGQALLAAGFTDVSNVTAGFEGDLGLDQHRHGGWKDALPWIQR